jgi:alkaline phosphatase
MLLAEDNYFKQPVNVPLASETHGGEDVAVYARGPMSHIFAGVVEQNYLAHAMAYASCVGSNRNHCAANTASGGRQSQLNNGIAWRLATCVFALLAFLVLPE